MNDIDIDNNETGIRIKDVINMLNEEDGDGCSYFDTESFEEVNKKDKKKDNRSSIFGDKRDDEDLSYYEHASKLECKSEDKKDDKDKKCKKEHKNDYYKCDDSFDDGVDEGYQEGFEEGLYKCYHKKKEEFKRQYELGRRRGYREGYEKAKEEVLEYIRRIRSCSRRRRF